MDPSWHRASSLDRPVAAALFQDLPSPWIPGIAWSKAWSNHVETMWKSHRLFGKAWENLQMMGFHGFSWVFHIETLTGGYVSMGYHEITLWWK